MAGVNAPPRSRPDTHANAINAIDTWVITELTV